MTTIHNGTHKFNGPLAVGDTTLTDSSTKVTFSKTVEIAGGVLATGSISGTHMVSTTAEVDVDDADYTLAEGVGVVKAHTAGADDRTITLGSNNAAGHTVQIYASSIAGGGTFAIASAEGTTTLDATDEAVTYRYNGTDWRVVGYHGTTGPA